MLLVPEGIVRLNETAVATLELVDGLRDADDIAKILAERYDANGTDMARDVRTLLEAFAARGFVREA
jgi:coenzyme PQQ biosynthesis protein PqqD